MAPSLTTGQRFLDAWRTIQAHRRRRVDPPPARLEKRVAPEHKRSLVSSAAPGPMRARLAWMLFEIELQLAARGVDPYAGALVVRLTRLPRERPIWQITVTWTHVRAEAEGRRVSREDYLMWTNDMAPRIYTCAEKLARKMQAGAEERWEIAL